VYGQTPSGTNTVALGYQAAAIATAPNGVTAIGYQASSNMSWTSGTIYSTSVGYQAGKGGSGATNYYDVAVGAFALTSITSGILNIAIGYKALQAGTTASSNVAIGYQPLYTNTTGSNNVAVGHETLYANTTAANNTAVGYQALYANTTGTPNVAVGHSALSANTTGTSNTATGYQAGVGVTTATDGVYIGNAAGSTTTTGSANTYIGSAARGSAATNNREIVIGFSVNGQGTNTVTLGSDAGKIYNSFTVNATWTQTSDVRMKTNIQEDSLGLSFINRLRPVTFTWKPNNELDQDNPYYAEENKRDTTTVIHGLIAQEVKAALDTEGVDTFAGWDVGSDGVQAISREMFISPLIKAVQELTAQVETLKAEVAALKGN